MPVSPIAEEYPTTTSQGFKIVSGGRGETNLNINANCDRGMPMHVLFVWTQLGDRQHHSLGRGKICKWSVSNTTHVHKQPANFSNSTTKSNRRILCFSEMIAPKSERAPESPNISHGKMRSVTHRPGTPQLEITSTRQRKYLPEPHKIKATVENAYFRKEVDWNRSR